MGEMARTDSTPPSAEEVANHRIASELIESLATGRQVLSIAERYPPFDVARGYRVANAVRTRREARGERPVGRKIGFTNRTIWDEYGVHHPIWGFMYDTTVHDITAVHDVSLTALAEPRIEPEIIFGLAHAPTLAMNAREVLACVAWVAHGFEIVQSVFAGWRFTAADTVAAFGLHGALFVGPRHPVSPRLDRWLEELSSFQVTLHRDGQEWDRGQARNVLDGPIHALKHLVGVLAADPSSPPLAAGEIVTTGTVTRAFPVEAGQVWNTALEGISLEPASIRFTT